MQNAQVPRDMIDSAEVYRKTAREVAAALGTHVERGLSAAEASARLARFGRNELGGATPVPAWRRFLAQFEDVLVLLLLVATAISAGLWFHERDTALPYEAIAIFVVVLLNATMGFFQEARAAAAVAALREMAAADASVVRDGTRQRVPAGEVVPGDVVLIEEGDTLPADGRLVLAVALSTAEAALTGESLPVPKHAAPLTEPVPLGDRQNMVFSGTAAVRGRGVAVVTATGMRSEMGRIAGLLETAKDESTPLQRELDRTGRVLGLVVVAIAVIMIVTIVLVEGIRDATGLVDVMILGVALAVAAVPEGLPAIVTAVLSIGVQRMARRNAIVRHLSAVETLGSASVIASDKTGTLTKNEMTVRAVITASGRVSFGGSGYTPAGEVHRDDGRPLTDELQAELERVLVAAERANNASLQELDGRWQVQGDPTEGALLVAARKAGVALDAVAERLPRVGEIPFASERKLMSTIHREVDGEQRIVVFAKGAADVLLERCTGEAAGSRVRPLTDTRRREIVQATDALAEEAMRTLGIAFRVLPRDASFAIDAPDPGAIECELAFAGLVGMIDPPRAEAAEAVARARAAGVRPIMITGDHPRTATVIARELGISADDAVITGTELAAMDEAALRCAVASTAVYARVNPEHKLRIVDALQADGAIVAMTGDGVNDAPALKSADIGVAMGITGTDVSKEAADIVLADDNFTSIVAAVEEGRAIFANVRRFLRFLLSSNIGEVLTMFLGVLLARWIGLPVEDGGLVLPLLATQILWINLVTDGAPALALGVDPADDQLMRVPPRPVGEGVITGPMWRGIALVGITMAVGTLLVLDASLPGGLIEGEGTLAYGQTMAFTTLMLFQLFNVFNARSDDQSAFRGLFTNAWLWAAVLLSLVLQLLVLYVVPLQRGFGTVPLSGADWARCAVAASSVLWVREVAKLVARRA